MHYANDNAVVKAIYDFTHGPQRGLFIGIVVALARRSWRIGRSYP